MVSPQTDLSYLHIFYDRRRIRSLLNQQETSIAAQLDGIQAYCDREDITLIGMPYIDEAKSSTNTNRPGFQCLLADAQKGKSEEVVYDISRGSRDVGDWFVFRKQSPI